MEYVIQIVNTSEQTTILELKCKMALMTIVVTMLTGFIWNRMSILPYS